MLNLFAFNPKNVLTISGGILFTAHIVGMNSKDLPIIEPIVCASNKPVSHLPINNNYEATGSSARVIVARVAPHQPEVDDYGYAIINSWDDFRLVFNQVIGYIDGLLEDEIGAQDELVQVLRRFRYAINSVEWANLSAEQQLDRWHQLSEDYSSFIKRIKEILVQRLRLLEIPVSDQRRVVYSVMQSKIIRIHYAFLGMSKLVYNGVTTSENQAKTKYRELFSAILLFIPLPKD